MKITKFLIQVLVLGALSCYGINSIPIIALTPVMVLTSNDVNPCYGESLFYGVSLSNGDNPCYGVVVLTFVMVFT